MTRQLILIFVIILCSCGQKDNLPKTTILQDTTKFKSTPKFDEQFSKTLTLLQESNLQDTGQRTHEFRFYYFPSHENYKFFKFNYADSMLTVKEFSSKKPDGSGEDKLLTSKVIKFDANDYEILKELIDKSMFWYLEPNILKLSIDGSLYIYESKQFMTKKMSVAKDYQIVRCNAPNNSDFINLGQFLLFKTGYKNVYAK